MLGCRSPVCRINLPPSWPFSAFILPPARPRPFLLPVKPAGFYPHAPLGPCTCDLSLFGFLQQGLAETTSMLKAAPGSAQHVSWKPLGAGGQEMAGAASHRHRMVCLDRRHAEITFPAAVPVPGTGVPDPTGCQSPFSWGSRSLGHTSAFPGGSFQPGRGFCAGCPTRESCFFPK